MTRNRSGRRHGEGPLAAALIAALLLPGAGGCAGSGAGPGDRDTRHLAAEGALGPYSGSVLDGDYCFASGKIGRRDGSFEVEVETALDAVEAELARSGLGLGDLVQVTVYLTDMELYGPFNGIYARRVPSPYPARACVAVRALPAGARVEIMGVARRR